MPWEQREFADVAVDRIRSMTRSLARYQATSTKVRGKLVPETNQVALLLEERVKELRDQHPDSAQVRLAAEKFYHVWNGPTQQSEGN